LTVIQVYVSGILGFRREFDPKLFAPPEVKNNPVFAPPEVKNYPVFAPPEVKNYPRFERQGIQFSTLVVGVYVF
jgi:hypothetical protein